MHNSRRVHPADSRQLTGALDRVDALSQGNEHSIGYFRQHRDRFARTLSEVVRVLEQLSSEYPRPIHLVDFGSHELHTDLALRFLYPDLQISGVDIEYFTQAPHIQRLAAEHRIQLQSCDFAATQTAPLEGGCADVVLFFETLEHFNFHPLPVIQELARIVRPGGYLLVTTPNQLSIGMLKHFLFRQSIHADLQRPYSIATHYRLYSLDEVASLMKAAGLMVWRKAYLEFPPTYLRRMSRLAHGFIASLVKPWANNMIVIGHKTPQ